MPWAKITVEFRGRAKTFTLPTGEVVVGRGHDCDLVLPFPGIQERHLEIQFDAGCCRIRCLAPEARARIAGRVIGLDWQMMPEEGSVEVPAQNGRILSLDVQFKSTTGGSLLVGGDSSGADDDLALEGPEVVEASPFAGVTNLFEGRDAPAATALRSQHLSVKFKSISAPMKIMFALLAGLSLFLGAVVWRTGKESRDRASLAQTMAAVSNQIDSAQTLVREHRYIEARKALEAAHLAAANQPSLADFREQIERMRGRPEIRFGGIGYVSMEGQWLPPERASAWKAAREKDDPKIKALYQTALTARQAKNFQQAEQACDDAIAIMDGHPVKPHPEFGDIQKLRSEIHNQIVAAEMTAKGLVLYDGKWVTPQERFRFEQQAKGLVEFDGKWMTKDEAFAAEQTAKGLVLHEGKWMTLEQAMTAKGYVQFEGKWILPAEKSAIIAQREEQRRQAEVALKAEQQRLIKQAEARKAEAGRIESLKRVAYEMSQLFIKDKLISPATAQFEKYGDPQVFVIYEDGWFLVSAVVDAQNSFGAVVRAQYVCKLRPVGNGDRWESQICDFVKR